jgi:NADH-quinone oxidoreductase subunit H
MVDTGMVVEWIIKSLVLILGLTVGFAYLTWLERRLLARFQSRIGPNRAGPFGLGVPIADAVKAFLKEELIPHYADKVIFVLAPVITVVPALTVLAVIPWGEPLQMFGRQVSLYISDVNVGIVYILAITSISVYGIALAGWSSNNKYALLGGLRATAQMISYELALGLSIIGPALVAGSLSLVDIVHAQQNTLWYVFLQPAAFILFFISSTAEINRAPFDMPEAEQELTAGYHTEYSGMKFALFFMAEYIKMIAVSVIGSTLFLGGFDGPFVGQFPWLGPLYLIIKTVIWLMVLIWLRATWPRIRYDRLMSMGWKILFPLALLNVIVTAIVVAWVG